MDRLNLQLCLLRHILLNPVLSLGNGFMHHRMNMMRTSGHLGLYLLDPNNQTCSSDGGVTGWN